MSFPTSPANGQTYTTPAGLTYTWVASPGYWKPTLGGVASTADGNMIVRNFGGAAPGPADGIDGDYAFDYTSGKVWGAKAAGAWPATPVFQIAAAAPGVAPPKIYAWGLIDNTSGTPALVAGSGVAAVSMPWQNGQGTAIKVDFSNAMPDTNFTAVFSVVSYNASNSSMSIQESYGSRTTSSIEIVTGAPAVTGFTNTFLSFIVFHP